MPAIGLGLSRNVSHSTTVSVNPGVKPEFTLHPAVRQGFDGRAQKSAESALGSSPDPAQQVVIWRERCRPSALRAAGSASSETPGVSLLPQRAEEVPRSRNRREWTGSKNGHDLFEAIGQMGKLGLRIERAENAKQPVPLCLFYGSSTTGAAACNSYFTTERQ